MAAGTNLGSAFYEILPDLNVGQFLAAGTAAGAALAQGINNAAGKGLQASSNALLGTLSRSFSGAGRVLTSAISGTLTSARGLVGTVNTLAGGMRTLGTAALGAAGALGGGLWRGLNLASDGLRSLGSHIGIASFQLQILGGMLTSLVTGPLAAAGIALAKFGLTAAMNLEDAIVGMEALLGFDPTPLVSRLRDLATSSPVFAFDEITDFARKLLGVGLDSERTMAVIEALNRVFITFGVSGDRATNSMLAVSQVFQKGTVSAEELTRQLGQNIPIWHLLAQAAGVTDQEFKAMHADGEVTVEMFEDLLIKMGQLPQIAEGAAKGVGTLRAVLQQTKEQFSATFSSAILEQFPTIKAELDRFMPVVEELTILLVRQIPFVVEQLGKLVDLFFVLKDRLDALNPAQRELALNIAKIVVVAGPALLVLGGIATLLSTIIGFVSMALNPWVLLVAGMTAGFAHLYRTSEDFRLGVEALRTTFIRTFVQEMPAMGQALLRIVNVFMRAFSELSGAAGFETWVQFGEYVGEKLPKLLTRGLNAVADSLERILGIALMLRERWNGLDESTQRHIKTVLAATAAYIVFLPQITAVAGFIAVLATNLRMLLNPWGVAVAALAGGFIYLYKTSKEFHDQVNLFVLGFKASFAAEMPSAVRELVASLWKLLDVVMSLFPNLQRNIDNLGLSLGVALPRLLADGVRLMADAISFLADGIAFLRDKWRGLDAATQDHIKTALKWAAVIVALSPVLAPMSAVLGSILGFVTGIISPFTVMVALLGGGFYFLYTRVAEFRRQVNDFVAAFKLGFETKIRPALLHLTEALRPLAAAVLRLLGYFGLQSWRDFGGWAGGVLASTLAFGINLVASAIQYLAAGMQLVMDKWDALSPAQQDMVLKFGGLALAALGVAIAISRISGAISGLLGNLSFLMSPWLIAVTAIGAGLYYLYQNNETFRGSVDAFGNSFMTTFGEKSPEAIQRLKDAINTHLIPAFQALARALGFETLEEFGAWLGEKFAVFAVAAIDGVTWAVLKLADAFRWLAENMPAIKEGFQKIRDLAGELKSKWDELDGSTQKVILAFLGTTAGIGLTGGLHGIIGGLAGGVGGLITKLAGAGGLTGALGAIVAPAGVAVAATGGLTLALGAAALKSGELRDLGVDMGREFKSGFSDSFKRYATPAIDDFKEAFNKLTPKLEELAHALGFRNLKEAAHFFGEIIGGMVAVVIKIGAVYLEFVGFMIHIWAVIFRTIKTQMQRAIDSINIGVIGPWNWVMKMTGYRLGPPLGEIPIPSWLMNEPSQENVQQYRDQLNRMAQIGSVQTWGNAPGYASGGYVSGAGTALSDSIHARLSNGEFVMNARATQMYGGLLEALNQGRNPSDIAAKLMSLDNTFGYHSTAKSSGEYARILQSIMWDKTNARRGLSLNSMPSSSSSSSLSSGPNGGSQGVSVTVYVGDELLVNKMQAVVDQNNQAIIQVGRSSRRPY